MNYIFDFGNVLVRFEPYAIMEHFTPQELRGDAMKQAADVIFDRKYWDELDRGTVTEEEILPEIRSRIPAEYHEIAWTVLTHWYEVLPEIPGMREYVTKLKEEGHKLYLLSNISVRFEEHYREVPELASLLGMFDGIVCTGKLHIVKPSPEIFAYLLEKYGLDRAECRFTDDNAVNINAAERAGIRSDLFTGCPLFKEHEAWDVYDMDRVPTGRLMYRGLPASPEDLHMVVHLGMFDKEGRMLIQRRQLNKAGFPGMWDVTLAGSVGAGEDSRLGIHRELLEELGMDYDFTGIRPFFTMNFQRGFDDYYLLDAPEGLDPSTLKLQETEVMDVRFETEENILAMIDAGTFVPYHKSVVMLMFENRTRFGAHSGRTV